MSSSYRLREDPNDQRITLETNELMGGEDDDEEATDFANYVESDDDDEDPYFMPEHNKKSSTLTFSRYNIVYLSSSYLAYLTLSLG